MSQVSKIFVGILTGLLSVAILIGYADLPVSSSFSIPAEGIVHFSGDKPSKQTAEPDAITVVSYNIGYASGLKNNLPVFLSKAEVLQNLDAMIATLKTLKPDLLFLQEVDFNSARTYGINQMEYLARGLETPYAAYVVTWNKRYVPWPYWPPKTHFGRMLSGQAVLSRFPILQQETVPFPKPKSNPFWYNWFYLNRILQNISVQARGHVWHVWNAHLEAFDAPTRAEQVLKLADHIHQEKGTLLAVGDYNEDPGMFLKDFAQTGLEIDHIYYTQPLLLRRRGHFTIEASDHFPVWAQFQILR